MIKKYMFGVDTVSKWERGCPIIWTGVWQGKPYEDKGIITEVEPENKLQYTHFSSLSGVIDAPENYHTVTYSLSEKGDRTLISVTQDNNADEKAMIASKTVWENILTGLKTLLES
jgi:uncharacterized protein YndB with AHSA1/START domain